MRRSNAFDLICEDVRDVGSCSAARSVPGGGIKEGANPHAFMGQVPPHPASLKLGALSFVHRCGTLAPLEVKRLSADLIWV
jgi:hypothetical protein